MKSREADAVRDFIVGELEILKQILDEQILLCTDEDYRITLENMREKVRALCER